MYRGYMSGRSMRRNNDRRNDWIVVVVGVIVVIISQSNMSGSVGHSSSSGRGG